MEPKQEIPLSQDELKDHPKATEKWTLISRVIAERRSTPSPTIFSAQVLFGYSI